MFSPRQLRRMRRGAIREIRGKMREDLKYLVKPKPKYWPKFIWIYFLKKLIDIDFKKFL